MCCAFFAFRKFISNRKSRKENKGFMRTCDLWKEIDLLICPWMWYVFHECVSVIHIVVVRNFKGAKECVSHSRSVRTFHFLKIHSECLRISLFSSFWYKERISSIFTKKIWFIYWSNVTNQFIANTDHIFIWNSQNTYTFLSIPNESNIKYFVWIAICDRLNDLQRNRLRIEKSNHTIF